MSAYARALREGRVDDAYALTSASYKAQVTPAAFRARYADAQVRDARSTELDAAQLVAGAGSLALAREGDRWAVSGDGVSASDDDRARAALEAFVAAVERRDFDAAYALLSERWRARYSPERFKADFEAESGAPERLSRAKAAAKTPPQHAGNEVLFAIGEGRAVRLVREGDGYRVAAIE